MTSKIKNIIILSVIIVAIVLVYIFFIKKTPEENNLVSSPPNVVLSETTTLNQNSSITKDLLSVLLSVKSIKLEDSIFSNTAFISLKDSSISLTQTGDEGRTNPFAPIGYENVATPPSSSSITPVTPTETQTENSIKKTDSSENIVPVKTPSKVKITQ